MKKAIILLITICLVFAAIGQSNQNVILIKQARDIITTFIEKENIQGLSITISKDDQVIWSEGYGYSDLQNTVPIEPDSTLFRIASISKSISATGLAFLYEKALINIDTSAYIYLPNFPKKRFPFTLRELGSHRAGIRHYKGNEIWNRKPYSIEEGIDIFKRSKLIFEPGTQFEYSSYSWNLVSLAIQNALKMPFEKFMQDSVLNRIGMHMTIPDNGIYYGLNISNFYSQNNNGKTKVGRKMSIFYRLASGGYLSTSEDLVNLGNTYLFDKFIKQNTKEAFLKEYQVITGTTRYGIGWRKLKDGYGRAYYGHGGQGVGADSLLLIYPTSAIVISILSNVNCDHDVMYRTAHEIVNIFSI